VVAEVVGSGQASRHRLDALYDLAVELSAERRLDAVLDVALRQGLELTDSEFGFIGLVADGSETMDIVAIHGFHPAPMFYDEHRTIPLRPNVFARVVLDNTAVRTIDAGSEPGRVGQPEGHPSVGAFLGVPLRVDGLPIGMIGLANRPTPYEDDHERLLLTYAGLVAMHVRNAQLYEALSNAHDRLEGLVEERTKELAQARDALEEKAERLKVVLAGMADAGEKERRRIASDLHDGVNQLLIGAILEVTSGRHRVESGQAMAASSALESAQRILGQVESEIRRVIYDLHPPVLEGLGLVAAARELVDRFAGLSGVDATVEVTGDQRRFDPRMEIGLYRMIQEALHNVLVHAAAREVEVLLTFSGGDVQVEVSDDGKGFDPSGISRSRETGFGLDSMRRRIEDLTGVWSVVSRPGGGTRVVARVSAP